MLTIVSVLVITLWIIGLAGFYNINGLTGVFLVLLSIVVIIRLIQSKK